MALLRSNLAWERYRARGKRAAGLCLLLAACCLPLGCYDPDPIDEMIVSPDGRWVALHTQAGEINLLDLRHDGPMRLLTSEGDVGLAFSPDSARLAMIEHQANTAPALRMIDTLTAAATDLSTDSAWKGSPVWLNDRELAFRSDLESEDINVHVIDTQTRQGRVILDRQGDVAGLWSGALPGSLVYRADTEQQTDLWLWNGGEAPQRIASDPIAALPEGRYVAAQGGGKLVFQRAAGAGRELVLFDAQALQDMKTKALEAPLTGLAALHNGRIAAGQRDRMLIWWPGAPWYRDETKETQWHGAELGAAAAWGPGGVMTVANQNLLLAAEEPDELRQGQLHSRRTEDLARLAYVRARGGDLRGARAMLADVWEASDPNAHGQRFVLALAQGRLERMRENWDKADAWMLEALAASEPGGLEHDAALGERLAMAAFDRRDEELTRGVLEDIPEEAVPPAGDLRALIALADENQLRAWMRIAGRVRAGEYQQAAQAIRRFAEDASQTTVSLAGIRLVGNPGIEPLGLNIELEEGHLRGLMAEPEFQGAILALLQTPGDARQLPDDLRNRMLLQWARLGNFIAARELAQHSLADDRETADDYIDMLRQFLGIEDAAVAMDSLVRRVLLEEKTRAALIAALDEGPQHLWLRLAQTKGALVDGDVDLAQSCLDSARGLLGREPGNTANIEDDAELAQQLFYISLFQAKIHERNRSWNGAAVAYRQCVAVMDAAPGYWDVALQEIIFSTGLVEMGPHDPETVTSYQRVLRGMGDPLLNPAFEAATIQATYQNLQTMLEYSRGTWLEPYLEFSLGMCHSQAGRRAQALDALARARGMNPPVMLLQRILMEEAANRDSQGQHALAARLYDRVLTLDLPVPMLGIALLNSQQAQAACGMLTQPTRQMAERMEALDLPRRWRDWLWLQSGTPSEN